MFGRRSSLQEPTRRRECRRRHCPLRTRQREHRLARSITRVIALALALSVLINYMIAATSPYAHSLLKTSWDYQPPTRHSVVLLFLDLLSLPPGFGWLVDRFDVRSRDGSRLVPVVPARGRHRRLAYFAALLRPRRLMRGIGEYRRLSLLRKDPGPICSGSWPVGFANALIAV